MAAISTLLLGVTAATAVASVGLSAFGTKESVGGAQDAAAASQQITQGELKQDQIRQEAAAMDARRRELQTIRESQKARAMALTSATAQGAGLGSGLQGGYGQIQGDTATNYLGIAQNLEFGQRLYDVNANEINPAKVALSQAQGRMATGQGMSSFGGSLMNSVGTIGRLAQGFGSPSSPYGGTTQTYGGFVSGLGKGPIY